MRQLRAQIWSPYAVGFALGVLNWVAFATVQRGLGVSTAFEYVAAHVYSLFHSHLAQAYLSKQSPRIGWETMLVIGIVVGSFISTRLSDGRKDPTVPTLWAKRFGKSVSLRITFAFFGGMILMLGARLAKGCTSGHGITGALQLAVSSWVFILLAFAVGCATSFAIFGSQGKESSDV